MGEGARRDTRRRLTIDQAADQLGITVDAVRGRVKRHTIAHVREGGRVYVLLAADQSRPGQRPGHDQNTDQDNSQDNSQDSSQDSSRGADFADLEDRTNELIATLQEQLQAERQAHAEARRLLAAALERIPAIEAPQEAPQHQPSEAAGSPATASEGPPDPTPRSDTPGPQTPPQRRSLWRRIIGR